RTRPPGAWPGWVPGRGRPSSSDWFANVSCRLRLGIPAEPGPFPIAPGQEFSGYVNRENRIGKNGPAGCPVFHRDLGSVVVDPPDHAATTRHKSSQTLFPEECPMKAITKNLVNFLKKEDGPTAVEYAVMLALIIVVCIAAITALGSNANNTFSYVASKTQ